MNHDNSKLQERFWECFALGGNPPNFAGTKVLDIGCGLGQRCLDIAARGAYRVVGIDPIEDSIQTAVENLKQNPTLAGIVEYLQCTIHELEERDFDIAVSENAFEHIIDVPEVLNGIHKVLKPGGLAYIGFCPLYHSPFGDHGWMQKAIPGGQRFLIPWGHLLVPQQWLFRRMENLYEKPVRSTINWPFLALNQKTAGEYRRLFRGSGMRIVLERSNANFSWKGKLFGLFRNIPCLDPYFTMGMYYILEK